MRARAKGICASIKTVLADGGKTYREVCDALPQYPKQSVSASLGTLVRLLYVTTSGQKKNQTYTMRIPDAWPTVKPADKPKGLQKYWPPIRPLQRSKHNDVFAKWRLCERDTFNETLHIPRLVR